MFLNLQAYLGLVANFSTPLESHSMKVFEKSKVKHCSCHFFKQSKIRLNSPCVKSMPVVSRSDSFKLQVSDLCCNNHSLLSCRPRLCNPGKKVSIGKDEKRGTMISVRFQ